MKVNHFSRLERILAIVCLLLMFSGIGTGKEKVPPTKSIRGHVMDARNKSIAGAKVYIRNVKKKTTTVLITDEGGLYSIYGLDPKVDYEVQAEHGGLVSEKKSVSSFLNRFDNVFNFQLKPGRSGRAKAGSEPEELEVDLQTSDGVKLAANWTSPSGGEEGAFPSVLLIHDLGEDSRVWEGLVQKHLLPAGFAVLSLDLRGHGRSAEAPEAKTGADPTRAFASNVFPPDIAAAVRWLKSREDVDVNRISVVGCGLGADLAYLASGKHEEIRSAVAISANAENAKRLSAGIQNFLPHAILFMACDGDQNGVASARELEKLTGFPVRVQIYENSAARGKQLLQEISEASLLLLDWLKKN
jgi:pimeloyl-ACP methyl ester carboxylesterase